MPGTARDWSGRLNLGASYADLNDPEVNLTYGQRHLEMLRDSAATEGHLPKIMLAPTVLFVAARYFDVFGSERKSDDPDLGDEL